MIDHWIKKLLWAFAAIVMTMGLACAEVEINQADQAALDGVKGIGPKLSRTILDARKRDGNFKDWDDFAKRVKGVGVKSTDKLSQAGLRINGQSKPNAPIALTPAVLPAPPDQ